MKLSPLVRITGMVLAITATLWFAVLLYRENSFSDPLWREADSWRVLSVYAVYYACLGLLLAVSWTLIVSCRGKVQDGSIPERIAVCSLTQIYKYLPSNTLHLVGRHALFYRLGHSNKQLVAGAIVEQILLASSAVIVVLIVTVFLGVPLTGAVPVLADLNIYGLFTVLAVLTVVLYVFVIGIRANDNLSWFELLPGIKSLATAMSLYVVFFFLCGYLLGRLPFALDMQADRALLMAVIACFSIAWVVGNFTPGSPAGIGVRETLLVVLLDNIQFSDNNGLVVLGFRLVTLAGDSGLAIASYAALSIFKRTRLLKDYR